MPTIRLWGWVKFEMGVAWKFDFERKLIGRKVSFDTSVSKNHIMIHRAYTRRYLHHTPHTITCYDTIDDTPQPPRSRRLRVEIAVRIFLYIIEIIVLNMVLLTTPDNKGKHSYFLHPYTTVSSKN